MAISGIRGEQPVLEARSHNGVAIPSSAKAEAVAEGGFSKAMRGLARSIDAGEAQVKAASTLRNYDTGTLIALQSGIYRYTEAVDLASKIVDRASSAVRTVLQGGGH